MVDRGIVRMDDPVSECLPSFFLPDPYRGNANSVITLGERASHASGLGRDVSSSFLNCCVHSL